MPKARGTGGAALAVNSISYASGIAPDLNVGDALFRFDLATETWTREASMLTPRDHLRLEAVRHRLYAISGREYDLRHHLSENERYNIELATWKAVADIRFPHGGFASVVHAGFIYTFGGEHGWKCLDSIERYDPFADTCTILGQLPGTRQGITGLCSGRSHSPHLGGRYPRILPCPCGPESLERHSTTTTASPPAHQFHKNNARGGFRSSGDCRTSHTCGCRNLGVAYTGVWAKPLAFVVSSITIGPSELQNSTCTAVSGPVLTKIRVL